MHPTTEEHLAAVRRLLDEVAADPGLSDPSRAALDDAAFRALFARSAVKRIGRDRFVRNVLIAIGNSGRRALAGAAAARLDDAAPIVRGAAVWALSRLVPPGTVAALSEPRRGRETDPDAGAEWDRALGREAA